MSTPYIDWLNEFNYPLTNPVALQAATPDESHFIAPLIDYSLIRVTGLDAEKFMQGQFSCDVSEVTENVSRLGTANTPKGRAYAAFRIAKCGDDYLIRLPSVVAPDVMDRLNKYIVFFKAELRLEEALFPLGVVSKEAALVAEKLLSEFPSAIDGVINHEGNLVIRVPGAQIPRYEIWCEPSVAAPLLTWQKKQNINHPAYSQADWLWFELTEGIAEIVTETQESFVPQMLNLQHLNAISFTKGCYTGQEIIARMKYLGKLKKNMFLLSTTPAISVSPGDTVWSENGDKKSGVVVRSISTETSTLTLAVLDIESVKSGNTLVLHQDHDDNTTIIPLPYTAAE